MAMREAAIPWQRVLHREILPTTTHCRINKPNNIDNSPRNITTVKADIQIMDIMGVGGLGWMDGVEKGGVVGLGDRWDGFELLCGED